MNFEEITKVHFISVDSWNDSANISGFPYRFYFGFFGMKSQNFTAYYSARICLIKKRKLEKNEEENEDEEEKDLRYWIGIGSKAYNLIYNPAKFQ